jgi:cellulose synthase/poly-beta-1,6-N-acetylglucosamine synthase-like glycosyltransferase
VSKELTLSIIIPVYNEQNHIKGCLEAIAAQVVPPDEVIIVDNNCVDKTVEIAKTFDFVKVVKESRQGRAFARSKGFDTAKGAVLGRIDADSRVAPDWTQRVLAAFENPDVVGVTGPGQTNVVIGVSSWYATLWARVYFWAVHSLMGAMTMWGANMAVRRSAWQRVRSEVCMDDRLVHEDQDISLWLLGAGGRIIQDNKLLMKTVGQSYIYWPKLHDYIRRCFQTRKYHRDLKTLDRNPGAKMSFWALLPGAIMGWSLTAIFVIYSIISWPLVALLRRSKIGDY